MRSDMLHCKGNNSLINNNAYYRSGTTFCSQHYTAACVNSELVGHQQHSLCPSGAGVVCRHRLLALLWHHQHQDVARVLHLQQPQAHLQEEGAWLDRSSAVWIVCSVYNPTSKYIVVITASLCHLLSLKSDKPV